MSDPDPYLEERSNSDPHLEKVGSGSVFFKFFILIGSRYGLNIQIKNPPKNHAIQLVNLLSIYIILIFGLQRIGGEFYPVLFSRHMLDIL